MNQTKYKICKLNEVAWFQEGPGVRKSQFRTSGVKLLNVGNICDRELVLDKTSIYISEEEAYGKYKHFLVDEGDLLIASSGIKVDYFDKKITFARKEHLPLCMNTSTIRFKVLDKTQLDIHYLRHFLASRYFTKQVQFYITGSAQLNFGPSHLNKMTIILPPLEEQKKIAKILDKADEIRAKKKLANDKLDEFLKSTFISMFGDPIKNEKNYRIEKLQNVTKFLTDGKHGDCEDEDNSGYYFVSAKCINNGKIDLAQARQIKYDDYKEVNKRVKINVGDLLIVNTGATIGKMAIIRDESISKTITLQKSVAVINMDNDVLNSEYLSNCLLFKSMAKVSAGSAIHNLLLSTMRAYELPIPPIEEQNKFAKIVEKVEAQKQKNELVIEQMNNLFNSLSQRAFKGEL